ncbi:MAG TPA: hypothetical protein VFF06_34895 [Polyangia bacterium]|nr:hypothetical protein [Polyangia bacterium]
MEAKGGSDNVLMASNYIHDITSRAIMLGGENCDDTSMWGYPGSIAAHNGTNEIARNNIIVNVSESGGVGIGIYGCSGCAADINSVWDDNTAHNHLYFVKADVAHRIPSNVTLAGGSDDLYDNLFGKPDTTKVWCTISDPNGYLSHDYNEWWMPAGQVSGCATDTHSFTTDPMVTNSTPTQALYLKPLTGSPLIRAGIYQAEIVSADGNSYDYSAVVRDSNHPTLGALEP